MLRTLKVAPLVRVGILCAGVILAGPSPTAAVQGPENAGSSGIPTAPVEARLLARPFVLPFAVTADGVLEVSLEGELRVGPGGDARLEARGSWMDQAVELAFASDGEEMAARAGERENRAAAAPEVARALVVGLTRMGVLHNLARLTGAAFPDHAGGGVGDWVVVHRAGSDAPEPGDPGAHTPGEVLALAIEVMGQPVGHATLVLTEGGDPLVRTQVVAFPQGEMRVTERYGPVTRPEA